MRLDENSLVEYLADEASKTELGPAPIQSIRRRARRKRHQRRGAVAVASVVVLAGLGLAQARVGWNSQDQAPASPAAPDESSEVTPDRLARLGDLPLLGSCPATASEFYNDNHGLDIAWVQEDCTVVEATTGPAEDTQPAVSHAGTEAAFIRYPGGGLAQIVLVDRATNSTTVLLSRTATMGGLSWSPDDQEIAFSMEEGNGRQSVYLLEVATKGLTPTATSPTNDFRSSWSPDGQQLAWVRGDDQGTLLQIWDRASRSVRDVPGAPRNVNNPVWLDLTTVLVTRADQVLAVDIATGQVRSESPRLGAGEVVAFGTSHGVALVALASLTDPVNELRLIQLDDSLEPVSGARVRIGASPSL